MAGPAETREARHLVITGFVPVIQDRRHFRLRYLDARNKLGHDKSGVSLDFVVPLRSRSESKQTTAFRET